MQADVEALRVADYYASHPLLRAMSVPRFRLPDVEVDMPVIVDHLDEPRKGESMRGSVAVSDIREAVGRVLPLELEKHNIDATASDKKKIDAAMEREIARLIQPAEVSVDVNRQAHGLAKSAVRIIAEAGPPDPEKEAQLRAFESDFRDALRVELLKIRPPPPRLQVMVTTREIREAGPTQILCRINLKICEEQMEWTLVESDGEERHYLVPE
jgi:hypothetical protein